MSSVQSTSSQVKNGNGKAKRDRELARLSDRKMIEEAEGVGDPTVDTYWCAIKWLKSKVDAGLLSERKAQNHISAVKGLASILTDDEPVTVKGMLDNWDELPPRWARKNPDKEGSTAGTYRTNGRWLLDLYTTWCMNPEKFDNKLLGGRSTPTTKKNGNGGEAQATRTTTMPRKKKDDHHHIPFALGTKGTADLALPCPPEELTLAELSNMVCQLAVQIPGFDMRAAATISSHLATRTPDFDPLKPIPEQLFQPRD